MDWFFDRRWMGRRKIPGEIGVTEEFESNCEKFVAYAYEHRECVNSNNHIRCPCARCKNKSYHRRDMVMLHLFTEGFMTHYEERWWAHGENIFRGAQQDQSTEMNRNRMSDMVRDIAGPDFDWAQDREQEMNSDASAFFKLLEEDSEPLWPGCKKHSILSAVATLLNIKSDHNMSKGCFESILTAVKSMLPENEKLPENLYYCKKMVKKLGLGYEKIDSCPNDCMLFYKEDAQKRKCTICGNDRFQPNKGKKKDVAFKSLRYFPITDRLKRLYLSKQTAEQMTWHARSPSKDGELNHPADGLAWKEFNRAHPEFASEARNVRLGLSTDGFNPFGHSAVPYSCWPVIVTPYNLPPWICMTQPYLFLSLLIPGPKSPGKDLDVYLRPLIDELKQLWDDGVEVWDASTKTNFNLKAVVMWTISDFPAYGMLSGWSTHGKMSCPYCMEHTKAFTLSNGRKPCFFDCHRRFLPVNHPFRKNRENFKRGKVEHDPPAPRLSGQEVLERVMNLPNIQFGKNSSSETIPGFGQSHNWVRRSIFWELPYWSTNLIRHNLDVMHIEKNVFDNVFNTVMDVKDRTKDNAKARMDMKIYCRRPSLELYEHAGKVMKPHASYTLTKQNIESVCGWIKTLKLPDGYASNIARCVSKGRLHGMKTHDCHVFMERLLPLAFRGFLDMPIWHTLTELSCFFRDLCSKVLYEKDLDTLETNIIEVICKLEKIFPPGFFDSMEHLPIHLVYEARVGGPLQYRWMYAFERLMGGFKRNVKNKARVEGSISEAYSFSEISMFMSNYFPDEVVTKAKRVPRHDDGGEIDLRGRVSIFGLAGRPHGKGARTYMSDQHIHVAHTCILLNCQEMDDYVSAYDRELRDMHPGITDLEVEQARDKQFAYWIKDKTLYTNDIPQHLQALAMGPDTEQISYNGYITNGYEFHKKEYAVGKKTTNTGIMVKADCYDESGRDFYGEIEDIVELSYKGMFGGQIVLFKCRWFDSEKGIRVDRHGIVDINMLKTTYEDQPFVFPTHAVQVYFTPTHVRKRERGPADWQVVIHTRARNRFKLVNDEVYQEEILNNISRVNANEDIQVLRGRKDDDEEIVRQADFDSDQEPLNVDDDTESEEEVDEDDDGYESAPTVNYESDDDAE